MENLKDFFEILLNSEKLIHYGGLTLLLIVIFAETGLIIGFIFPGDALLFTAGLLCGSELTVNLHVLVLSVIIAAIAGNVFGYYTGKFFGVKLLKKKDTFFFKQRHFDKSRDYYAKYGGFAIIAGRFLPVVRTFVPILAGTIGVNFWKFNIYNITGAILWAGTLIPLGYYIGKKVPASLDNIEYFVLGITTITMTIMIRGVIKYRKRPK
ncbi:MAG: VTT domain-containing protein [Bacteroidales bacterium]|nr:VTT domain-containing protein [Bacteroidales bacterium]